MIRNQRFQTLCGFVPRFIDPRAAECSLLPIGPDHGDAGPIRNAPLAGLAGSSMSHRFRAWVGRSGRRYVFSVFAGGATGGLPADAAAIVIAAERRDGEARRMLWVDQTEASPEAFFRSLRVAAVLADDRCELHLHLLAEDPAERRAIVKDLDGRAG